MFFFFLAIVALTLPMCIYYSKNPFADKDRMLNPLPLVVISVGVSSLLFLGKAIQDIIETGMYSMLSVQGLILLGIAIWGLTISLKKPSVA